MKVSLNWLKEYVDINISPTALCDALTMAGLEVEGLEPVGDNLQYVVAGRIVRVDSHPDADRLSLCLVDTGSERVQVVCGAPNLHEGTMAPLALPGAYLPIGTRVKESEIRGQTSHGMLLAEDELGLTDDHTGIMLLPDNTAPGTKMAAVLSLPDWIIDISITPNRGDCACVIGIAREIAAITGEKLNVPAVELDETGPAIETLSSVTIEDPVGCPRYAAGILQEIELRPSPFWMRYRLFQSGVRSINNIVDITNYVMMEMGQPLHAFDYNRLQENRIVVKRASDGDSFTTLDGQTRKLNSESLMICDATRFVAVAGIMGGLNSEIFAGTRNVLVESAFFDPITIRRGAKRLGLSTEASYRFERGIDIENVPRALKRSLGLMQQLGGGKAASGIIDAYPRPHISSKILFRPQRANAFLGTDLSDEAMIGYFRSLHMDVAKKQKGSLQVTPPSFRIDIQREVDLIEEVARLYGYDNIPISSPLIRLAEERDAPELVLRGRMRSLASSFGFTEVITYSFVSPESLQVTGFPGGYQDEKLVRIMNPLSTDQSVMRTSLVPGLLTTLRSNIAHGETSLRIFEWGKIFLQEENDLPDEKIWFAGLMSGAYRSKTWYSDEREVDYYDAKGIVEGMLENLGVQGIFFQRGAQCPPYDPEFSSQVLSSGTLLGQVGQVSRDVMKEFDLENEKAFLFDLDIASVLSALPRDKRFQPFAKYPAVYRDISMVLSRSVESGKVLSLIKEEGKSLVESVQIFDFYQGRKMAPNEKALGFRICYRSPEGTLEGAAVNDLHEKIIERIRRETGGRLREG
ncbi:MAG: phenylalanine--tRNA ligase subunit beta [Deltaproteobacteria bacterium]|nr:MAG: phenylalanine--tRNA ligase subunit beta [Deltaproteobacteria bacterium]